MWWSRWWGGVRRQGSHVSLDTLSEYLDARLSGRALQTHEEHLRQCPACRQQLASLQAAVRLLRRISPQPVPRSFALHPAPEPVGRGPAGYGFLALRGASAAATFLLSVMLVLDFSAVVLAPPGAPAMKLAATEERSSMEARQPTAKAAPTPAAALEVAPSDQQRAQERAGFDQPESVPKPVPSAPTPVPGTLPAWQGWLTGLLVVASATGWGTLWIARRQRRKGDSS